MPNIKYDHANDMAYIKVTDKPVARSEEVLDDFIIVDVDADEQLVGIEVMSVQRLLELMGEPEKKFTKEDIPLYLLSTMYNCKHEIA